MPDESPTVSMDTHFDRIEDRLARMEGKIDALVSSLASHGERLTRVETWREDHQREDTDRVGRERWVIGLLVAVAGMASSALVGLVVIH